MAKAVSELIRPGVVKVSVPASLQRCEDCNASLNKVSGDDWWGEQDGIYIACPKCGHVTHFPG